MLDLSQYWDRFDEALKGRYDEVTFKAGFAEIEDLYRDVTSGHRRLTIDDVMALFADTLQYVQDWTMPDREELEMRMSKNGVAETVYLLRDRGYDLDLVGRITHGFRELSLTALVLHHVYPNRFAMCSHHLASLLYMTNVSTVPRFYLEYCQELKLWSKEKSSSKLSVAQTEFALWTWYRLTYYGRSEERKRNRDNFFKDPWVRNRRSSKIAESLKELGRLDVAWSYLDTDPTVAAIAAWLEFELMVRKVLAKVGVRTSRNDTMDDLIRNLPTEAIPQSRDDLKNVWRRRNDVMHQGEKLSREAAEWVLQDVLHFVEYNA
jgi:hypothetical protein